MQNPAWSRLAPMPAWLYIAAGALALWNLAALVTPWAISYLGLVAAWVVAWLIANYLFYKPIRLWRFPAWMRWSASLALLALVAADIHRYGPKFANRQGINLAAERFTDKVRLESLPSIAPSVIVGTQPQSFYIYAPEAGNVSLEFEATGPLAGQDLGYGVFRVDYNPRLHGPPSADVSLVVDDEPVSRTLKLIEQPAHPRWLRSSAEHGLAVTVSEETDELIVIKRSGEHATYTTGDGPTDALLLNADLALVSHRYEPDLWLIRLTTGDIEQRIPVGFGQLRLALQPGGARVAVASAGESSRITLIDVQSWQVLSDTAVENPIDWLGFDASGQQLIYSDRKNRALHRRELRGDELIAEVEPLLFGRPVAAMSDATEDGFITVAVTGYDPTGVGPVGNHFVENQLLRIDVPAWTVRSQHITARSSDAQRDPAEVRYGGSPLGLALDINDNVLVAFAGTDDIWRYSTEQPPQRLLERESIDGLWAPHSAVDLGDGVIAVSSPSQGAIGVFDAGSELIARVQVAPPDSELSEAALAARRGERTFYETARRGLSCQSCHMYGDSDHARHNIAGERFSGDTRRLPTLTLRGIADTAPYLRDASYHSVGGLIAVAEKRYDGYVRKEANRSHGLDHYAESLILRPNARVFSGRDLERERAGHAVFNDAGCQTCHTAPSFTNLSQHLPSSLFPDYGAGSEGDEFLDTPSLFALTARYPYLQDGRAETLRAVFAEHNPADLHGQTADLSEAELNDLIYFLESL